MFKSKLGIAQIPVLIGLLIMAIALPVASTLVKQTQDTRGEAATEWLWICGDNTGSGQYLSMPYSSLKDCKEKTFGQCWSTEAEAKEYCKYKFCNRCSNNNGCERVYFRTKDGNCETTIKTNIVAADRVTDCNCPKRYGTEGGNDGACTSCMEYGFCMKVGTDSVQWVSSGKFTEGECLEMAKKYKNIDTGWVEYDRGNVGDFCVPDGVPCSSKVYQMYFCNDSACKETFEKHFSEGSCQKKALATSNKTITCFTDSKCNNTCPAVPLKFYVCENKGTSSWSCPQREYVSKEYCESLVSSRICVPVIEGYEKCTNLCKPNAPLTCTDVNGGLVTGDGKWFCAKDGNMKACNNGVESSLSGGDCVNQKKKCVYQNNQPFCKGCEEYNQPKDHPFGTEICQGDVASVCQTTGFWKDINCKLLSIPHNCVDGKCVPVTTPTPTTCRDSKNNIIPNGSFFCDYNNVYSCTNSNKLFVEDCKGNGCENGKCKTVISECNYPNQWVCKDSNTFAFCTNDKKWGQLKNCPGGCSNDLCNCRSDDGKNIINSGLWGCKNNTTAAVCSEGVLSSLTPCANGCENGYCNSDLKNCMVADVPYNHGVELCSYDNLSIDRCDNGVWRNSKCGDNQVCSNANCVPCGSLDQICCAKNTCNSGLTCSGNKCVAINQSQCTAYDGAKVNSGVVGCFTYNKVTKCNNGFWDEMNIVRYCSSKEKCVNGQCIAVFCDGAEGNVAAGSSGCRTSSARAICMVNASGNAVWGADIPCASGVCKNGACEGEALKCSKCANNMDRAKGDADCDGKITLNDWAIWLKEFETGKGTEVRTNWLADFDCDGKVTGDELGDLNIWFSSYLEYQSK